MDLQQKADEKFALHSFAPQEVKLQFEKVVLLPAKIEI
jgi:hypothetical protein